MKRDNNVLRFGNILNDHKQEVDNGNIDRLIFSYPINVWIH